MALGAEEMRGAEGRADEWRRGEPWEELGLKEMGEEEKNREERGGKGMRRADMFGMGVNGRDSL